jgi:hypothetical protein
MLQRLQWPAICLQNQVSGKEKQPHEVVMATPYQGQIPKEHTAQDF